MRNNTLSRAELAEKGNLKNIHYGDILTRFGNTLNAENSDIPYIISSKEERYYSSCLQDGDLIIADTAEDYIAGKSTEIYGCANIKIVAGLHTIPCRPQKRFAQKYLGYYTNSPAYRSQILPLLQGIKVFSINKDNLSKTFISYPSLPEQQKIAAFLSLVDERIEKQRQLVEALKKYKRGLLKFVFGERSANYVLETLLVTGKAGGTPSSSTSEYYNGNIPFLSISDMTNQGKYLYYTEKHISDTGLANSSAWLVPENSLVISMYASYGLVAITKTKLATSQAMFSMIFSDPENIEYMYYYLGYLSTTGYYDKMVSTGTQPNLNAEKIRNIPVYMPEKAEKSRIIVLLKTFDKQLHSTESNLHCLETVKNGLLQQMFI